MKLNQSDCDCLPLAVVMISLNEAHNLDEILMNIKGWAKEIFLVDSHSSDKSIDIALRHGVHVVQRSFKGFGDQWNFALNELPVTAPWTMKLDPDERLTDKLKLSIRHLIESSQCDGIVVQRRLWFMGRVLPINQAILRVWRTGRCKFSDVLVNEHPLVDGRIEFASGILEHHDSPHLDHWVTKQNRYTTAEAISQFEGRSLSVPPKFFGSSLERRMWLKRNFWRCPFRYQILFLYHLIFLGAWRVGRVGWIWSRLRTEVYRLWEFKLFEMNRLGHIPIKLPSHPGCPDSRVRQYE